MLSVKGSPCLLEGDTMLSTKGTTYLLEGFVLLVVSYDHHPVVGHHFSVSKGTLFLG